MVAFPESSFVAIFKPGSQGHYKQRLTLAWSDFAIRRCGSNSVCSPLLASIDANRERTELDWHCTITADTDHVQPAALEPSDEQSHKLSERSCLHHVYDPLNNSTLIKISGTINATIVIKVARRPSIIATT
jgi:hypothetical protein